MMFSKILWTPDDATKVDLSIAPSVSLFLADWPRPRRRSSGAGARSVPSKGGANKKAADENKKGVTLVEVDAFALCPKAASPSLNYSSNRHARKSRQKIIDRLAFFLLQLLLLLRYYSGAA